MKTFDLACCPGKPIQGEIYLPGDKSITHRALLISSVMRTRTRIINWLDSADTRATLGALSGLGVNWEEVSGSVYIHGVGLNGFSKPHKPLDCGNSGTTIRLLSGLLAGQKFQSKLIGDSSLSKRPMERIAKPLSMMRALIETTNGRPPLSITGKVSRSIDYHIKPASAQVKSALQLASLYINADSNITMDQPCRDHTDIMLEWAKPYICDEDNRQELELTIPGDISAAAFFIVGAVITPGSNLVIHDVLINPTRITFIEILQLMGADIKITVTGLYQGETVGTIYVSHSKLRGVVVPKHKACLAIDEIPVLSVAASVANGKTTFIGVDELKVKESDRFSAIIYNLNQLGIVATAELDSLHINGGTITGGELKSFQDHRIIMAFCMAASVASDNIVIKNCASIATSFPNFIEVASSLGCNFKVKEHVYDNV